MNARFLNNKKDASVVFRSEKIGFWFPTTLGLLIFPYNPNDIRSDIWVMIFKACTIIRKIMVFLFILLYKNMMHPIDNAVASEFNTGPRINKIEGIC
jgi:hypothetical protein